MVDSASGQCGHIAARLAEVGSKQDIALVQIQYQLVMAEIVLGLIQKLSHAL